MGKDGWIEERDDRLAICLRSRLRVGWRHAAVFHHLDDPAPEVDLGGVTPVDPVAVEADAGFGCVARVTVEAPAREDRPNGLRQRGRLVRPSGGDRAGQNHDDGQELPHQSRTSFMFFEAFENRSVSMPSRCMSVT